MGCLSRQDSPIIPQNCFCSDIFSCFPTIHLPALPETSFSPRSTRCSASRFCSATCTSSFTSYPRELFTVFVAADNCTDDTARVAREHGAVVHERFNTEKVGKGYALEFLYGKVVEEHGDAAFDAYIVFDADNVLDPRYLEEMNRTFSDGYEVVTSYRNSKNYGDNWISAGYALWFLRESEYLNHARMLLGTSCAVSGTGFLFSSKIMRETGGWKFFLLTEDIEFTVYNVVRGRKIGYAKNAELYDEQPVTFAQSWRQRLRWAKGYIQVWGKFGGSLLKNLFSEKFTSCYDMTMTIMPALVISILTLLNCLLGVVLGIVFDWGLRLQKDFLRVHVPAVHADVSSHRHHGDLQESRVVADRAYPREDARRNHPRMTRRRGNGGAAAVSPAADRRKRNDSPETTFPGSLSLISTDFNSNFSLSLLTSN